MYHLYVGDFFIRSFEPLLLAPPYFQDEENNLSTFTHRHQHDQTRCPLNSDIGHLCLQSSHWRTSQHLIPTLSQQAPPMDSIQFPFHMRILPLRIKFPMFYPSSENRTDSSHWMSHPVSLRMKSCLKFPGEALHRLLPGLPI